MTSIGDERKKLYREFALFILIAKGCGFTSLKPVFKALYELVGSDWNKIPISQWAFRLQARGLVLDYSSYEKFLVSLFKHIKEREGNANL